MKRLPIQVCSENFAYLSDLSVDNLRGEIKKMLDKAWDLNFSPNMTGDFLSENEFKITPRFTFAYSAPSLIRMKPRTTLLGTISKNENNVTQINLTIDPNPLFSTLFIFFPILMSIVTLLLLIKGLLNFPATIVLICFTIVFSYVILDISKIAKLQLLNRFVTYFSLTAI